MLKQVGFFALIINLIALSAQVAGQTLNYSFEEPDLTPQKVSLNSEYQALDNPAPREDTSKNFNELATDNALKSALVPGLGQIENNQVWKAPIVWAGLGFTTFLLIDNNNKYQDFAKAYKKRTDGNPNTVDKYDPQSDTDIVFTQQGLKDARETFRRYRTLSAISIIGVYGLNILDAYVFAHLKEFDVSDNLTMSVNQPKFANIAGRNTLMTGITLNLKP